MDMTFRNTDAFIRKAAASRTFMSIVTVSFVCPFTEHSLNAYYVPDTVADAKILEFCKYQA